jgi:hypothetical protein
MHGMVNSRPSRSGGEEVAVLLDPREHLVVAELLEG